MFTIKKDLTHFCSGMTEKIQTVWPPVFRQRPHYYLVEALQMLNFSLFQPKTETKGAHSIDFSGVRDDKCHKAVGDGQVQFLCILFMLNFFEKTIAGPQEIDQVDNML